MALTARVTTVNGEIVDEKRDGQHRVLIPDPQGNVIEVQNDMGATLATYNYWPYGAIRTSTGSLEVNPWRYSGAWGAYYDGPGYYMRARVFRPDLTRWMTVDPLWPEEWAYGYVRGNPTGLIDPLGLLPCSPDQVRFCTCECNLKNLDYKSCKVIILPGPLKTRVVECGCKPPKCPKPIVSEVQAYKEGHTRLIRGHGKCSLLSKGFKTPADICENGTHQTWTFMCGKKKMCVSVICCPCSLPGGKLSEDCWASIHKSRFQ